MKDQNSDFIFKVNLWYLSWFKVGHLPKAPGTWGTLASLPFIYAWSLLQTPWQINFFLFAVLTIFACWSADVVQRKLKLQDPQWIVIDEVIGMFVTWAIVQPSTLLVWSVSFVAFRVFDIIKIWPASYFDKKVKNGAGTILDDVVSGVFAGVLVSLISHFLLRNQSNILSF